MVSCFRASGAFLRFHSLKRMVGELHLFFVAHFSYQADSLQSADLAMAPGDYHVHGVGCNSFQ